MLFKGVLAIIRTGYDIYPEIERIFAPGDVILIKGSRVMELEKLTEKIHEVMK